MIDRLRRVLANKLPPGSMIRDILIPITDTTLAQALMILVATILTQPAFEYTCSTLYGTLY
jgi:hypothetical protein